MGNGNLLVRMIVCALLAIIAWNAGIFVSRTFIQHVPYEFSPMLCFALPMIVGCAIGFFWKSK